MTNRDFFSLFLFCFMLFNASPPPAFSMCSVSPCPPWHWWGAFYAWCLPFLPAPLGWGWTAYNARLQGLRQSGTFQPSLRRLRSASVSGGFLRFPFLVAVDPCFSFQLPSDPLCPRDSAQTFLTFLSLLPSLLSSLPHPPPSPAFSFSSLSPISPSHSHPPTPAWLKT